MHECFFAFCHDVSNIGMENGYFGWVAFPVKMSTFMDNAVKQSEQCCIKEVKLVWATDHSQKYRRLLRSNMISKTSKSVIYCLKPNKHDICPKKITQPQYLDTKFYTKKAWIATSLYLLQNSVNAFQGYHSPINQL